MACSSTPLRNGFTLVEMLVALFVFGLISAAGVTLLRSTADSQIQLRDKLGERATLSRLSNLIEADLAQAVPRPTRIEGGSTRTAFETGDGKLFTFSRIGAAPDIASDQSSRRWGPWRTIPTRRCARRQRCSADRRITPSDGASA